MSVRWSVIGLSGWPALSGERGLGECTRVSDTVGGRQNEQGFVPLQAGGYESADARF